MNKTMETALLLIGVAGAFYASHLGWGPHFDTLGFVGLGLLVWRLAD